MTVVCILTAGQGSRMGPYASLINKCLLPYKSKAIISHIIEAFPSGTEFVIALGYKAQQVRSYLQIAHPNLNVTYVEVDNYAGPGSGPGYSLHCCRKALAKPFYFVSCDTIFEIDFAATFNINWVGVARVEQNKQSVYCNMLVSNGSVTGIIDKQQVFTGESLAFSGLMYISDFANFWQALGDNRSIAGEHQVSNGLSGIIAQSSLQYKEIKWLDLGTYEQYKSAVAASEEYDFSKTNEFLYITEQSVIKFFSDEKIVAGRIKKAGLKPEVFPCISATTEQFYGYDFVPGKTLYSENTPVLFDKLLIWLENNLWSPAENVSPTQMQNLCQQFYQDKTLSRLMDYNKKYPQATSYTTLNGQEIADISDLMQDLPWQEICLGIPTFMHGDLQFDNILYDRQSDKFVLLDWRQDFAGVVEFGDIYYDLAKLLGGIIINYDYIKAGLFMVNAEGDNLQIDFAQRFAGTYYVRALQKFIEKKGFELKRVRLLLGLIYLNMSPLHHPPFDQALHGLGRLILTQILYPVDQRKTMPEGSLLTALC